ncbi:sugar ABC transporter substrate-binding protein [Tropicimonas sp. IMCC6043]|uniref:ABC transporter substrate-binding protein n=1 Tax=Tropicimonas sp. IMCC6043 TaxID=2510645 RepID=UPI00101C0E36|nr:sugar ABC transporter substrate-binding protein [Tropicimonas sp. IMCC6043]RYH08389.1 sugar ABC transporter substrate-binding protein [Tropicimonas sp. IMCC6043]
MKTKILSGALILAATGLGGVAQADSFTLWVRSDGSEFMPKLVEAFNAKGEHEAQLQIVPVNELVQKYAIAAAGGSAPDALSLDLIYTPAFAAAGQLKDITDLVESLPYRDALSPAHMSVGTYDGRIYGLPFSADASVLLWNKDLYRAAGLDPEQGPTTWAEIREDAEAIAALGDDTYGFYFSGSCGGCNVFTFTPLIWASGGDIFADEGKTATLASPEVREAIDFYRGMVQAGIVPAGAQTDTGANFFAAFANGNIGISPSGSFAIGALNNQYPDLDYGVALLPGKEGGASSFAGGDNFVVSQDTENLEPIKAFLEFAYSVEGQTILANNGSLPVRADVAAEALEGLDARNLVSAEAMTVGRTPYSVVFNDLINSSNGPWATTLNRAFFAEDDAVVDEAVEEGQEEMQSIIDAAG